MIARCVVLAVFLAAVFAHGNDILLAAGEGVVRGVVHDPQHRPVAAAAVELRNEGASWTTTVASDPNGEFQATGVPEGGCTVTVRAPGFAPLTQQETVVAGKSPILHFQLEIGEVSQTVEVSGAVSKLSAQTSTVQTDVGAKEILETPGAGQTNSLAMITDYTPGAYMVHDMLHMRAGHQVSWFIDGIPVVNTNIGANVAPLMNPKNVAELEVERGGFSSEYGDRTYGFFNVVTPSGFDRDNQAEVVLAGGNFYSADDQLNVGGHTERFAYFASVDANRTNLGLETPVSQVIHDASNGVGGFASLLYNPGPKDQLRWVASVREDRFQVPNTPDQQSAGIRDVNQEQDYLVGLHWAHTFGEGVLFTLSPYFHDNVAHYVGGPLDNPFILDDNARSAYLGGRGVLQVQTGKHDARFGSEVWAQHDNVFFGLTANPGSAVLRQTETHWANSDALFVEDQYKAAPWLTFDLGLRFTHYAGLRSENAADPRLGAAIRIPHLRWILHGYYAYYYQPPPLDSLAGPSLNFALSQGYGFIPLAGERDIQHDIGLKIPLADWALEIDQFHTSARNFLDHDVIGNSGIFIPLSDLGAIVSGTEVTLRSPRLFHVAQLRVAYSNQIGQGIGPITGGLLQDSTAGNFLLDHDQRNTVSGVLSLNLPRQFWATPAYQFGSGFLNGNGPSHLPPHSTFDLALGKRIGENWTLSVNGTNLANTRYLLDTSNTFGGTHFVNARQVYAEMRYRFHF